MPAGVQGAELLPQGQLVVPGLPTGHVPLGIGSVLPPSEPLLKVHKPDNETAHAPDDAEQDQGHEK